MSSLDRAIIHRMALMTGGKRSQVDLPGGSESLAAEYRTLAPFLPLLFHCGVCACVYVMLLCVGVQVSVYRSQRTYISPEFILFNTVFVPGVELRLSGLAASTPLPSEPLQQPRVLFRVMLFLFPG